MKTPFSADRYWIAHDGDWVSCIRESGGSNKINISVITHEHIRASPWNPFWCQANCFLSLCNFFSFAKLLCMCFDRIFKYVLTLFWCYFSACFVEFALYYVFRGKQNLDFNIQQKNCWLCWYLVYFAFARYCSFFSPSLSLSCHVANERRHVKFKLPFFSRNNSNTCIYTADIDKHWCCNTVVLNLHLGFCIVTRYI